ncbi:MAG: hypothetical protein KDC73_03130 [Ignavibacteriae bacterium]|nr:hypothetical protein [Ignavibacteriota bacterium]MCB9244287.1 hypothetical protein [Ignavibacteriales bacterium]
MSKLLSIILGLFVLYSGNIYGQDSSGTVSLSIFCNIENAKLFLDSTSLGNPPVNNYKVAPGIYTLSIFNPSSSNKWEVENYKREIEILSDTLLDINFSEFYFIDSDPYNTSVYNNDKFLGLTPLRIQTEDPLSGILTFKKDEYKDYLFDLSGNDTLRNIFVKLTENRYGQTAPVVYKNKKTNFKSDRNFLAIGSFGAGALLGAASAIYFKNTANNSYDLYRQTFDKTDLDKTNRNDTYSLISLIVMQGAIAGLIYFLFFD